MSPKTSGENIDEIATITLESLGRKYQTEAQVLSGINQEAEENNRLVMKALEQAGQRFDEDPNKVFGFYLGGSRIKGLHRKTSDVDIAIVHRTDEERSVFRSTIEEELKKVGLNNRIDQAIEISCDNIFFTGVETDPNKFIESVDSTEGSCGEVFFGFTGYENPNLTLSRLAYLEIITKSDDYLWDYVKKVYAETYLGRYEYETEKISRRLQLPIKTVQNKFPRELFKERRRKFGLGDKNTLYQKTLAWYKKNRKKLSGYIMKDLYEEVKAILDEEEYTLKH